jgi:hypothetical protein
MIWLVCPIRTSLVGAVAALLVSACSASPFDNPFFVGASAAAVPCAEEVVDGAGCVRVFSEIDGTREGTGSCILYATRQAGRVAVAASGDLELVPGRDVEWIVPVPPHVGHGGWNPVCIPTAEG